MQQEEGSRESITSDAMEALIGAIYVDGGFANAKEFIQPIYFKRYGDINSSFMIARLSCRRLCRRDYKEATYLPCWLEKRDRIMIKRFAGRSHDRRAGHGVGKGRTKKAAEQEAAYQAHSDAMQKE